MEPTIDRHLFLPRLAARAMELFENMRGEKVVNLNNSLVLVYSSQFLLSISMISHESLGGSHSRRTVADTDHGYDDLFVFKTCPAGHWTLA